MVGETSTKITCTILVVTYNPTDSQVAHWVHLLDELDGRFNKLLVINSKELSSAESILANSFDDFIVNRNEGGLQGAYTKGLEYIGNRDFKWCFFCDQDSVFSVDYFEKVLAFANTHNYSNAYAYFGSVKDRLTGAVISPHSVLATEGYRRVSFPINSGMLINVDLILKNGGINTRLVIDYIDTDIWMRMRSRGYHCAWVDGAYFFHSIGRSSSIFGLRISLDSANRYKSRLLSLLKLIGEKHIPLRWWLVELSKVSCKLILSLLGR